MLYDFIDTTSNISAGNYLPAEAMSFNGVYLENEIDGYRTLSVQGRELASSSINDIEINSKDGTHYKSRRYDSRIITVKYQLITKSNSEFRKAFNKMNSIFAVEQAQIIFNDEPDKFFIGTTQGNHEIEGGSNSIIGEIEIYCADPFKYSVEEKEVSPTLDNGYTFEIDYKGTRKAYPKFTATMVNDNGYLAFINDQKKVLQFGDPDEVDGETYQQNEYLCHLSDFANLATDSHDYFRSYVRTGGSMGYGNVEGSNVNPVLYLSSLKQTGHFWTGGCKTLTLPADSNGERGAQNFYCYFNQWFVTDYGKGQTGFQTITFLTDDNKIICGVSVNKTDQVGEGAYFTFYANGDKDIKTVPFYPYEYDWANMYNNSRGHNCVIKEGSTVKCYYQGSYYQYTIPDIANLKCTKIQVTMAQWGERNMEDQYVAHNYLRALDFQKMHVSKWRDVPNKFRSGNVITVDCNSADVYLNGVRNPSLGALGNNWDNFYLKPGYNQIKFAHSSWARKPTVKLKYREVFL